MKLFELNNVAKHIGAFSLKIDSCSLDRGKIYSVTGPNGSGKTTLLELLSIPESYSGEILYNGKEIVLSNRENRAKEGSRIACLLQNPYLFNMSIYANAAYGLKVKGIPRNERDQKIEAMLKKLGLWHMRDRNAHNISGGEAQRTALARTLVIPAEAYLLDEPTANVDKDYIRAIEDIIRDKCRKNNACVVMTTHSKDQPRRMNSEVISLQDGRIVDLLRDKEVKGIETEN